MHSRFRVTINAGFSPQALYSQSPTPPKDSRKGPTVEIETHLDGVASTQKGTELSNYWAGLKSKKMELS